MNPVYPTIPSRDEGPKYAVRVLLTEGINHIYFLQEEHPDRIQNLVPRVQPNFLIPGVVYQIEEPHWCYPDHYGSSRWEVHHR